VRDVAIATHGQVLEALIANRLTSPRPLVHVETWAAEWAAEEVFGVVASALNDDRIGRALDALALELGGIMPRALAASAPSSARRVFPIPASPVQSTKRPRSPSASSRYDSIRPRRHRRKGL
jgi:hypothetical protein